MFYSYTHMATVGVKGLKTGKSLTMLKKNGNLKSMLFITGIQSYKKMGFFSKINALKKILKGKDLKTCVR